MRVKGPPARRQSMGGGAPNVVAPQQKKKRVPLVPSLRSVAVKQQDRGRVFTSFVSRRGLRPNIGHHLAETFDASSIRFSSLYLVDHRVQEGQPPPHDGRRFP
ncbi:unnamed protein product, partial [Ectocarpus sp. 8 AP-2014]